MVLEPYDESLDTASVDQRRRWSRRMLDQLAALFGPFDVHTFEIHAGGAYRDFGLIDGLRAARAEVEVPAGSLPLGQLLSFMRVRQSRARRREAERRRRLVVVIGLGEYLQGLSSRSVVLTFVEVEQIVGRSLPPSARRHRAWWANDASHAQARQWLDAAWRVDLVDLVHERVRIVR